MAQVAAVRVTAAAVMVSAAFAAAVLMAACIRTPQTVRRERRFRGRSRAESQGHCDCAPPRSRTRRTKCGRRQSTRTK
eukprot:4833999-Prymnesium_polylepis.1